MTQQISIIPKPQSLTASENTCILQGDSKITWQGEGARDIAELMAEYLRPATGYSFPVEAGTEGTIHLQTEGQAVYDDAGFTDESYALTVDVPQTRLQATNATGLARGIQTIRQLLPKEIFCREAQTGVMWQLPGVEIKDAPRFRWRGQHLDVGRHFFSVDEVCQFIDILALHRLNTCHLHLTEDQGWRIEIKKYPLLTKVGSRRECTIIGHASNRPRKYDNTPYGGYYTQEDIRKIVAFAAKRHINIVPEIDMPGHMVAAISAYPELGNIKTQTEVLCHWGISQSVLNVEESTITFMKNVLDEVMEIFPGRFIHIGGDEAPKYEWRESRCAQGRMAELGLHSENELQSWFIGQMNDHIRANGRRLIGWDEIMEGGLKEGATVMSWRGEEAGREAAALGHDVVMSPNKWTYFDYYQAYPTDEEPLAIGGMLPTDRVYAYNPVSPDTAPNQASHILGCQGQLWTEYIPNMEHLCYMGFPRICALSEVAWLQPSQKNYSDFLTRLSVHRTRLKTAGINMHPRP